MRIRKPIRKSMEMTMAQCRYAHLKLMGFKIDDCEHFHAQANEMFRLHGEAKIREAFSDFKVEYYLASKYDC